MKVIRKDYHIWAPQDKIWQALVDPKVIEKWGAGPAKMSDNKGAEFSIWGGDTFGKNLEVIKGEKLVQEWTSGKWEKPSKLTISLTHKDGCTAVHLLHQNVPDEEAKDIDDGWDRYYFGPLKKLLEGGN